MPQRCGGRHRLALQWQCLSVSVNQPLQLHKDSGEVLHTYTSAFAYTKILTVLEKEP